MDQSFVILGNNPSLSFAEVYQNTGKSIILAGESSVILDNKEIGDSGAIVFGGVPKSGVVIDQMSARGGSASGGKAVDAKKLASILEKFIQIGQKFHFGLSLYVLGGEGINQKKLKALGLETKKLLKQLSHSVRLVESKSGNLSSVDVAKNKLLDKGVELCLFSTKDGVLIGKTKSVQPFEEYSERDYGRPSRDMKRGMLPPKLAKSMVNLSGAEPGSLILDPFCGVGTVLQEALLLGYRVIGTDIDEKAVKQTKENIEWLIARHKKELPESKIDAMDVRKLDKTVTKDSIDSIVTEFDLGPPLSGDESRAKVESIEKSLNDFYAEALELMRDVLKDGSRAVVAWPYFAKHDIALSVFGKLSDLGWSVVEPYPKEFTEVYPLSERGTLLYGREDQYLFREILILEKA